jgi:phosphoglycerol transferase MdoB-like AlkP superfamily enzyme
MPILLDYQEVNGAKFGWDYETLMFAADKIDRIEKPFLVYIFTGTTHTPFPRLPNGLEKYPHNPDNEKGFLNTLNYTDWSIGEFMGRLKKRPWFNNTIFVFTGDHALAHFQTGPFPEKFHIPLIIYAPGMIKPAIVKDVSSQLDLFPTLIQLMNLEASFSSFGNNLLTPTRDPFAFVRNGSIVGIITSEGYLSHSLKNRLETGGSSLSPADFDTMEKKLLATDQMVYETLLSNQWAR